VGIIVAVLVAGVRRGYLSTITLIYILVAIPSIMFHEVSHGIVALWCGDDTAKQAGRISANPIRHIDPVGTIILPAIMALAHGPVFGWAKPVPVRIDRLRHPRNQAVLVGLAGPFSNYLIAAIAGGIFHWIAVAHVSYVPSLNAYAWTSSGWYWAFQVFFYLGLVNVLIGTFNLIPIPPLDGSAIIERLLPQAALPGYYRMRMGFMVLVLFFVLFDQNALIAIYTHVSNWYEGLFLPF
jgi:Zn-dependent protease